LVIFYKKLIFLYKLVIFGILSSQAEMSAAQARLSAAQAKLLTAQAEMLTTQARLIAAQAETLAAQAEMPAAQAEMSAAQARLLATQTRLLTAQARLLAAQADTPAAQTEMQAAQVEMSAAQAEMSAAQDFHEDQSHEDNQSNDELERRKAYIVAAKILLLYEQKKAKHLNGGIIHRVFWQKQWHEHSDTDNCHWCLDTSGHCRTHQVSLSHREVSEEIRLIAQNSRNELGITITQEQIEYWYDGE